MTLPNLADELQRLAVSERWNREPQLGWWKKAANDGQMRLRDPSRSWARQKVRDLRDKGPRDRPVSYATGNSAVLSACEEWEWISRNPLHSSGRRKKAKGDREKACEREEVPDEMARIRRPAARAATRGFYP